MRKYRMSYDQESFGFMDEGSPWLNRSEGVLQFHRDEKGRSKCTYGEWLAFFSPLSGDATVKGWNAEEKAGAV